MSRRRRNESAVVRHPDAERGIEALVPLIEASWSDADSKSALDKRLAAARPGSREASLLAQAADSIEDGDLLFRMAALGLPEALAAHALRALIVAESQPVIESLADAVASVVSGPSESVSVSIATSLVAGRVADALGLAGVRVLVAEILEERYGPAVQANVGDGAPAGGVLVAPAAS